MSSKSKALIGGALAVIFVITMFNTNAIVSLSNKVDSALSQKVAYNGDVMKEYYVGNQTASVLPGVGDEIFYPEPDDEDPGIPIENFWPNGLCSTESETASNPGVTYTGSDGQLHCYTGYPGFASPGDGEGIIHVEPQIGTVSISGTSMAATAMKLHVLGYANQSKMAPWTPVNISEGIKAFQRDRGISMTGKVGSLTTRALDAEVASLRVWRTERKYRIYSQDYAMGRQQAALGTAVADTPEPGGEGHWIQVFSYNGLTNRCTRESYNTNSGNSYTDSWDGPCPSGIIVNNLTGMNINPTTGAVSISGTGTEATALKLSLLGYMDGQSKMAPWPPTNIAEELKAFQKNNGISQTGTAGKLTTVALDAKIANLRAELVGQKNWISSYEDIIKGTNSTRTQVNDPSEYPEDAEIFYRYPEQ